MNKRNIAIYICSLVLFLCLYFFENNTGTRIVLLCSLLLPLFPKIRSALFGTERPKAQLAHTEQSIKAFSYTEADEHGDIRQYVPGDPVNRIHWKLSAKRDELLVRPLLNAESIVEKQKKTNVRDDHPVFGEIRKKSLFACIVLILLSFLLLFLIPQARSGLQELCNRIFRASEAVNAYAYEYFNIPFVYSLWLAILLLCIIIVAFLGITVITGSRLMSLMLMSGLAGFQVYFGLAFPALVNILLFTLYMLWIMRRPWEKTEVVHIITAIIVLTVTVLLIRPGVDAATEQLSEKARDYLSRFAQEAPGTVQENPEGENETRRVHTRSLLYGDDPAQAEKEYRLTTIEEEQISLPHRINYLKIALLLMLAIALLVLPFAPFLWLNTRRKKALDARKAFDAEDAATAVCAIFQYVIAWLEATGNGAGNLPYRNWPRYLALRLSEQYAQRFANCAALFEEAAYSEHSLSKEQRGQMLALLQETEQIMQEKADFRQKLFLKYKECLWV